MNREQFLSYWYRGAVIVGAIVVAVAALLLAIIATARSIQANAMRIISVAQEIVANTQAIGQLADTDATAAKLLGGARSVGQHASELADALGAPQAGAK